MKKIILSLAVLGLLVGGNLATANAQNPYDNTPGVNRQQRKQEKRIRHGQRRGDLTRDEAQRLKAEQDAIQNQKQAAKADGVVTKQERKDLHKSQKQAAKDIHRQKTDREVR